MERTFPRFPGAGLGAIAVLLLLSLFPVLLAQDLPSDRTGTLAAVFAPSATPEEAARAIAAADGRIVREGNWRNVIVVQGDAPGLAGRLRRAGAWLVLDPGGLAGCLAA